MNKRSRIRIGSAIAVFVIFASGNAAQSDTNPKGAIMTMHASGPFDVKLLPQGSDDKASDPALGRMLLDKQFHGDLEATGKGQMLTAGTGVQGSAVYVAIERISGRLQGRSGSFIVRHVGTMTRGAPDLSIAVVPDSGTDQLIGIAGTMTIQITDGKHFYDFQYTLPASP